MSRYHGRDARQRSQGRLRLSPGMDCPHGGPEPEWAAWKMSLVLNPRSERAGVRQVRDRLGLPVAAESPWVMIYYIALFFFNNQHLAHRRNADN